MKKIYNEYKRHKKQYLMIVSAFLLYLSTFVLHHISFLIEHVYARTLFPITNQLLSTLTSFVPFSIAEFLYVSLYLLAFALILSILIQGIKGKWLKAIREALVIVSVIYLGFMMLWGLNYYRQPLWVSLNMPVESSKQQLISTVDTLTQMTNQLGVRVSRDEQGIMKLSIPRQDLLKDDFLQMNSLLKPIPFLQGVYGDAKPVFLSKYMLYTQISGMYFPFTAEANVNMLIPDATFPFTVLHELAHQRGIALEDEANFVAFVTAVTHSHPDIQYSGAIMALRSSINALARVDLSLAQSKVEMIDSSVRLDMQSIRDFWAQYDGTVGTVSNQINDTYLKGNQQKDGVASYGRMVDLLVRYLHP